MNYEQKMIGIRRGVRGVRLCLGIVVTIGSAACTPSPDPTHQTVDYYRANKDARQAMVARCENDPGALGQTPDCINARQAAKLEDRPKSLRDLPPMGLSNQDNASGTNRGGSEHPTDERDSQQAR